MAIMEIPGYNIPYEAVMSRGLTNQGHENPHPHSFEFSQDRPYPLPEGEGISRPFKGQGGDGLTRAYSDEHDKMKAGDS